jgi:hypothetical protein
MLVWWNVYLWVNMNHKTHENWRLTNNNDFAISFDPTVLSDSIWKCIFAPKYLASLMHYNTASSQYIHFGLTQLVGQVMFQALRIEATYTQINTIKIKTLYTRHLNNELKQLTSEFHLFFFFCFLFFYIVHC